MRSLRRHHTERLKRKRCLYWNYGRPYHVRNGLKMSKKALGIVVNTPKPCSCPMCCNKRKVYGKTLAELSNDQLLFE